MENEVLDYHSGKTDNSKPGKIGTEITKACKTSYDLSLAYTPGVAIPCKIIEKDPSAAYEYTNKSNTVAVITNGSAVLGLGNIGALAGKPVMEGKALLFKCFADIDSTDVLIDSQDPDKIIETIKLISPTYGGINLEDIKAPECFYIEKELKKNINIPIFHDDQHGTAVVVGAGLTNALEIANKRIEEVKIVFSGAGAAGIACARFFLELGAKKENITMCDSQGVITTEREVDESKKQFAQKTNIKTLEEAIKGADVFVGVSKRDLLTPKMLLSMNKSPVVFALANPNPEIEYDLAKKTREDIILSTGRSDHPNQINNVLAFPAIFRGALDTRSTQINEEMKKAAVKALSRIAKMPPTEQVKKAYNNQEFKFGKDYLLPKAFDKRIIIEVSLEVAKAAIESGVAKKKLNLEEYRKELQEKFWE
jgi:malate dehydrogenase (oxaloacetate-decarboxylating)(NADP+)